MDFVIEENKLSEAKVLSDQACRKALELWSQAYENHASDYAPVDTGRLQNSIHHKVESDDTAVVETNVEYAVYQEMGTSRQSGTPYMRPAGYNHISEYKGIIESALK